MTNPPKEDIIMIVQKTHFGRYFFRLTTNSLLLVFINYSRHLHEFYGFTKVPDASKITRFKQDFLHNLKLMFDKMVDVTEPICQKVDKSLTSMVIFDTSGIETWITGNNPKYANHIIKQLKAYAKLKGFDKNFDTYKAACNFMPAHAATNHAVQQMYIVSSIDVGLPALNLYPLILLVAHTSKTT